MAIKSNNKKSPCKIGENKKKSKVSKKEAVKESKVEEMEVDSAPILSDDKKSKNKKTKKSKTLESTNVSDSISNKSSKKKVKSNKKKTMVALEKAVSKAAEMDYNDESDESDDDEAMKKYDKDFGFDALEDAEESMEQEEGEDEEEEVVEPSKKNLKTKEQLDEEESRTVHISNVSLSTKKKDVFKFLKKYGKVEVVRFRNYPVKMTEKFRLKQIKKKSIKGGRKTMSAFARFSNSAEAESALAANGQVLNGHHVFVSLAKKTRTSEQKRAFSDGCSIFIRNLPKDAEEENLFNHFSKCGEIKSIRIVRIDHECTGIAFITFGEKSAVASALKLDRSSCMKVKISVTKAVRKIKEGKVSNETKSSANPFSIHIGNLSNEATDKDLESHFSGCGKIESVKVVHSKTKAKNVKFSYGFVNFTNEESVSAALKIADKSFMNKKIRISRTGANKTQKVSAAKKTGGSMKLSKKPTSAKAAKNTPVKSPGKKEKKQKLSEKKESVKSFAGVDSSLAKKKEKKKTSQEQQKKAKIAKILTAKRKAN